jgi:protein involved in polysaccharide export with SLBB domain
VYLLIGLLSAGVASAQEDAGTADAAPVADIAPADTAEASDGAAADAEPAPAPVPDFRGLALDLPIRVGDFVHISMDEEAEITYRGEIDASGFVVLPVLGEFRVVGMKEADAAAGLSAALEEDLFQRATVRVRIIKRAPGAVYIYGAVKAPGPVPLPEVGEMTVLQAIAKVGGITAWASPEDCMVTRVNPATGDRVKFQVDLLAAFDDIQGKADVRLAANDVVLIGSANAEMAQVLSNEPYEIIVIGQVNKPGIILFAPGELRTFMRALFKAGNFTRFAKKKAVRLIRYGEDGSRTVTEVNAEKIIDEGRLEDDVELEPGDMIIVDEKLISF